jgi:hypothetical protein
MEMFGFTGSVVGKQESWRISPKRRASHLEYVVEVAEQARSADLGHIIQGFTGVVANATARET